MFELHEGHFKVHLSLLIIEIVCQTISTEAMQVLFGVRPLDHVVLRQGTMYKIQKMIDLGQHDVVESWVVGPSGDLCWCKELLVARVVDAV